MKNILQSVAFLIILAVALLADGLMDTLGPRGFILVTGPVLIAAGAMVWVSNRPQKKSRPRGSTPRNGRRPSRKG